MERSHHSRARFELPADLAPAGVACVKIAVPNDPEYLAMLIGILDSLKWSTSYARDDTGQGAALVARVWKAALDSRPIAFTECAEMILRQNPSNPCQLQQSLDEGETWSLAFDYSQCSNQVTVPAPYPGSGTGASDASAQQMRNIFEALIAMIDCVGMTREEYVSAATAYLRTFDSGFAQPSALGSLYDDFCPLSESEKAYYGGDCPYNEHRDEIEACMDTDGLMDWLNCASDTISNWLNDTSDNIMNWLNQVAAALSGNGWQLAAYGGAGGGAGFGTECGWHQVWDFTIDAQGWTNLGNATYVAGQGWAGSNRGPAIAIAGPTRNVTRQKVVWDITINGSTNLAWRNYDVTGGYNQVDIGAVTEWQSGDLEGLEFVGGLVLGCEVDTGQTWGTPKIVRIEEFGDGTNPW